MKTANQQNTDQDPATRTVSKNISGMKPPVKDPFQMLIDDHNQVKKNFEAFENTEDDDEKYAIFTETVLALVVHTKLEEELVYPHMKDADEDLELEATEEHRVVDFVITEMKDMSPDDETFDAKFTVLSEMVKHHIKEEENEAFPKMRKLDIDLEELAEQMTERKMELEEQYPDLDSVEPLESKVVKSHRKSPARKRATRARAGSKGGKTTTKKKSDAKSTAKKSASARGGKTKAASSAKKKAASTSKKKPTSTTKKKASTAGSKKAKSSSASSKKSKPASSKKTKASSASKKPTKSSASKKATTGTKANSKTSGRRGGARKAK